MVDTIELIYTPDYQKIKENFLQELIAASQDKPSSISFIRHHLPPKPLITHGILQGIVIGGTNYILSTEEIRQDGKRNILERKKGILPIFDTKQTLVNFLREHLNEHAKAIGINFGFPLQTITSSSGELDGKLLYGTKEHAFKGLNKPIGQLVKTLFKDMYKKEPKVSVANDTVCLALSGDGTENGSLVAGTGFNSCLLINENHKKILVNLEAGNFNKFDMSPILKKIDAKSEAPGIHVFEKTVSGKYLAQYFNEKIKELNLAIPPITTSQELSELSHTEHKDIAGDLARGIIQRSAFLAATALAGLYEFCIFSHQMQPGSAFTIIGTGSLLWNGWHYHDNIQKQLKALGIPPGTITIKHINDSDINGAIHLLIK